MAPETDGETSCNGSGRYRGHAEVDEERKSSDGIDLDARVASSEE